MPDHATPHISASLSTKAAPAESRGIDYLSTEEVARLLKVDPSTLRRWRTARPPQGPPFIRLSPRLVMYDSHDVRQWLADHRVDPAQAA
ncbi:helix-turn-helix domain-containing protein [Streptomyces abikoensis]|uniref:helix-turn-helix domain-containing protein n=1 Tax=Streptomyces abikoensis TaxID=97398 RepID=UPI0033E9FE39